jgi:hypothetical protein
VGGGGEERRDWEFGSAEVWRLKLVKGKILSRLLGGPGGSRLYRDYKRVLENGHICPNSLLYSCFQACQSFCVLTGIEILLTHVFQEIQTPTIVARRLKKGEIYIHKSPNLSLAKSIPTSIPTHSFTLIHQ